MRCLSCSGSGKVMSGGMIMRSCQNCMGTGKPIEIERNSKAYKKAKNEMKKIDSGLSDEDAEKILDAEFSNARSK